MPTFPIRIDAREIFKRVFQIYPAATDWLSSEEIRTVPLAPADYVYQSYSGGLTDLRFTVTAQGKIDFDASLDSIVSGRGSDTLVVHGVPVHLDVRYTNEKGVLLNLKLTKEDWITNETIRLVPAPSYSMVQGGSDNVGLAFGVGLDGKITYDSDLDIKQGGFARGAGTAGLELFGFPVLVDARLAGGTGVLIGSVEGLKFTTTAVQLANLLPPVAGGYFSLQFSPGVVSDLLFSLDGQGNVKAHPKSAEYLSVDKWGGVPRVTVTKPVAG